jgi:hypothetical protein
MKTLKIVDGKLSRDENGILEAVSGAQKASQDVANAILTEYSTFFDTGSTLDNLDVSSDVAEVAVERSIYDALFRAISKQIAASQRDRIVRIEKILTQRVDMTTVVFYVEVLHSSGETAEFATTVGNLDQTQLNHLLEIDKVYAR